MRTTSEKKYQSFRFVCQYGTSTAFFKTCKKSAITYRSIPKIVFQLNHNWPFDAETMTKRKKKKLGQFITSHIICEIRSIRIIIIFIILLILCRDYDLWCKWKKKLEKYEGMCMKKLDHLDLCKVESFNGNIQDFSFEWFFFLKVWYYYMKKDIKTKMINLFCIHVYVLYYTEVLESTIETNKLIWIF